MAGADDVQHHRLRSSTEIRAEHLYGEEEEEDLVEEDLIEEFNVEQRGSTKSPKSRQDTAAALAAMGLLSRPSSKGSSKGGTSAVEMESLLREIEDGGSGVDDYPSRGELTRAVADEDGLGRAIVPGGQVEIWQWSQVGYLAQAL